MNSFEHLLTSMKMPSLTMRDRLCAYALFGDIISWKLRVFVPAHVHGAEVLAKVLERYPIERITKRQAA
jgi:hypothetical protein